MIHGTEPFHIKRRNVRYAVINGRRLTALKVWRLGRCIPSESTHEQQSKG
jgi:hypothetical protein